MTRRCIFQSAVPRYLSKSKLKSINRIKFSVNNLWNRCLKKNMDGPDYQLALLLQHQLDQENSNEADFYLARSLQEDFNREVETENPVSLVYDQKKKSDGGSGSLVDPSWELVDPTPNIYNLFVTFNQRYFWDKLVTVCVSWSKRMTSCAGICSYHGKGGMCSITLSEPLLKLRPRKDLVETLLHEMIHAYLFVTHNNKDRDGHGPEFHKHMYRINKESGTNITVYHSFHDEVRLYKQHWWRCNGTCQNRKPYFGMVRRAMNRAPGPSDRWWDEHFRTCGGTFVKVREPEHKIKPHKETKPVLNTQSAGDIRKFLPNVNRSTSTKSPLTSNNKGSTNVHGFNNYTQNNPKVSQVSGNITGFSHLTKPQSSTTSIQSKGHTNNRVVTTANITKTKTNSNSTIVINKKPNSLEESQGNESTKSVSHVFADTGKRLTTPEELNNKSCNNNYSIVRNHWLNKFPAVPNNVNKRNTNSPHTSDEGSKKRKSEAAFNQSTTSDYTLECMVACPACEKQIKESFINSHLDSCLQDQGTKNTHPKQLTSTCNKDIIQNSVDNRLNNINDNEEQIECEICNMLFDKNSIETHYRLCIEEAFFRSTPSTSSSQHFPNTANNKQKITTLTQCPVCDEFIDTQHVNDHKAECLLQVYHHLNDKYNLNSVNEEIKCLVCNTNVLKSELNAHLDDCMGNVFDAKNDFNHFSNNEGNTNGACSGNCDNEHSDKQKYNCPFCMELHSELDMSAHLNECLVSDVDSTSNKSILMDSFSDGDIF